MFVVLVIMSGRPGSKRSKRSERTVVPEHELRGWKFSNDIVLGSGSYGVVTIVQHFSFPNKHFALKIQPFRSNNVNPPIRKSEEKKFRSTAFIAWNKERWDMEMTIAKAMYRKYQIGPAFVASWSNEHAGYSVAELWDSNLKNSKVHMTIANIKHIEWEVDALHREGTVHGDLYGTNILIRYNYAYQYQHLTSLSMEAIPQSVRSITVTDFGLSLPHAQYLELANANDEYFEHIVKRRIAWVKIFLTTEYDLLGDLVQFRRQEKYPVPVEFSKACVNCVSKIVPKYGDLCLICQKKSDYWKEKSLQVIIGYIANVVRYLQQLIYLEPFVLDDLFVWMLYQIPKYQSICNKKFPAEVLLPPIVCLKCNISSSSSSSSEEEMFLCGQCLQAVYCSRECQEQHWNAVHASDCGNPEFRMYRLL